MRRLSEHHLCHLYCKCALARGIRASWAWSEWGTGPPPLPDEPPAGGGAEFPGKKAIEFL